MNCISFHISSTESIASPIIIRLITTNKSVQEVETRLLINKNEWDEVSGRAKPLSRKNRALNRHLDQIQSELNSHLNLTLEKAKNINGYWLKDYVKTCYYNVNYLPEILISTQIKDYISSAPTKRVKRTGAIGLSKNSIRNLSQFLETVKEYESLKNHPIVVDQLDHNQVSLFQQWLLEVKGYSVNHAGLQLKLLKMICKYAEKNGVEVHPYTQHIESFTQRSKDRYLQTLSFEDIKAIKALNGLSTSLENAKKWTLIGLYIGQRISDVLSLTPEQCRITQTGMYIDVIQKKTDKHVTIGVVDPDVIKVLTDEFPYSISSQLYNQQLKKICRLAGINELVKGYKFCPNMKRKKLDLYPKCDVISSHDLRRSFATNYFGKIATPILMQITGHSKETTFLSYIGQQVNKDAYADAFMKVAATL